MTSIISSPTRLRLSVDNLDLICYDFDGVMTDNRVLVDETGREAVFVNRGDGMAIAAFRHLGIAQIIMSTESNPVVAARARKLSIPVVQGLSDKAAALKAHMAEAGADPSRVLYVGNDVNDLAAMRLVGYPVAPADAHPTILALACFVTRARGGEGVIRDLIDHIDGTQGAL